MAESKKEVKPEASPESKTEKTRALRKSGLRYLIVGLLLIVGLFVGSAAYVYGVSPPSIRNPRMEHLHFRMQVVVDGKQVDFSKSAFQTPYAKDQCSGDLSAEPIHFHDGKGQFVHVHWKGITGAQVLKNYGWNLTGGTSGTLGYRMDDLPSLKKVPIHGEVLPQLPKNAKFWIYTGDENGYKERTLDALKKNTIEQFLETKSNFMTTSYNPAGNTVLDWFFPTASAHAGHDPNEPHPEETIAVDETETERLTRINNLIGNVVIFIQPNEPSKDQVMARFTCGG
jgi:hypothetical protein